MGFKQQQFGWFNRLLLGWVVVSTASTSQANPFQLPETAIRSPRDLGDQDELFLHPFQKGASLHLDFGRHGFGAATLDRDFARFMMQRGMDPRLGLAGRKQAPFTLTGLREEKRDFSFTLAGLPVCDYQVKVQWVENVGPTILGSMPRLNADATIDTSAWPAREAAIARLSEQAQLDGIYDDLSAVEGNACWWLQGGEAYPSWHVILRGPNGTSYAGIADGDDVRKFEPRFFHTQGVAKIYSKNSVDGLLQEFTLADFDGTGFLESKYFYTKLDSSSNATRASAPDHRFIYNPGTSQFSETSIFTNATRTLQWYFDLGYDAFGGNPIALVVHAVMSQGGSNNAQYTPASGTEDPTIYVGDGDGVILQNMATDVDVVSHEFGHHVVYESITAIEGESLVLHEGLADFFSFARTDDPCLGESICPADNRIGCASYQGRTCLRLAVNNYTFGAAPAEAHIRSQFISGMLWDLRETDGIPKETLSKLVLDAVGRLLSRSKYEHLILAMLIADQSLHQGRYCSTILARAKARGLESRINNLNCNGLLPELKEGTTTATSATGASSSSGSKSGGGFCGVVGMGDASPWLALLTFLTPLGIGFLGKRTGSRGQGRDDDRT